MFLMNRITLNLSLTGIYGVELLSVTETESAILPQSVELIAQRRSLPDFQETRV